MRDSIVGNLCNILEGFKSDILMNIDIKSSIELYLDILCHEIEGDFVEDVSRVAKLKYNCLSEMFIDKEPNFTGENPYIFWQKFEQFVKLIYFLLEEDIEEYIGEKKVNESGTITPYLVALNNMKPLFLDRNNKVTENKEQAKSDNKGRPIRKLENGNFAYKRLFKSDLMLNKKGLIKDTFEISYADNENKCIQVCVALRNLENHQAKNLNFFAKMNYTVLVIVCELYIVNFFKQMLRKPLNYNSSDSSIDLYCDDLEREFKNTSDKYVPLRVLDLSQELKRKEAFFLKDILNRKSSNCIRLLGAGGAGKTTTLKHLAYEYAINRRLKKSDKVPVYVPFITMKDENVSIIDHMSSRLGVSSDIVNEMIEKNEIVLFLDGLNEIPLLSKFKNNRILELAKLLDDNQDLFVLISDRYEVDRFQNDFFSSKDLIIQSLSFDQFEEFIRRYAKPEEHNLVLKEIEKNTSLKEVLSKPLILSRAIEIIREKGELPQKESLIIGEFIQTLLLREKNEKKSSELNVRDFITMYSYAASRIMIENNSNNAEIELIQLKRLLIEAKDKFGIEDCNVGYLTRIGIELEIISYDKNEDTTRFYHQNYIDYFTSYYWRKLSHYE